MKIYNKCVSFNFLLRAVIIFSSIFMISSCASNEERKFESKRDRGSGFIEYVYSVGNSPDHWEERGYFSTLFYKDVEIGEVHHLFISPDKKYAFYNQTEDYSIYIFDLSLEKGNKVLYSDFCFPVDFLWKKEDLNIICRRMDKSIYEISINLSSLLVRHISEGVWEGY